MTYKDVVMFISVFQTLLFLVIEHFTCRADSPSQLINNPEDNFDGTASSYYNRFDNLPYYVRRPYYDNYAEEPQNHREIQYPDNYLRSDGPGENVVLNYEMPSEYTFNTSDLNEIVHSERNFPVFLSENDDHGAPKLISDSFSSNDDNNISYQCTCESVNNDGYNMFYMQSNNSSSDASYTSKDLHYVNRNKNVKLMIEFMKNALDRLEGTNINVGNNIIHLDAIKTALNQLSIIKNVNKINDNTNEDNKANTVELDESQWTQTRVGAQAVNQPQVQTQALAVVLPQDQAKVQDKSGLNGFNWNLGEETKKGFVTLVDGGGGFRLGGSGEFEVPLEIGEFGIQLGAGGKLGDQVDGNDSFGGTPSSEELIDYEDGINPTGYLPLPFV